MTRLRHLLLAWLLVPTLVLWSANIALTTWRSLVQARDAFDRTLLGAALVIAERMEVHDGELVVDLPVAALEMLKSPVHDRIYYRVSRTGSEAALTGYPDLPPPPAASGTQRDEPVFYDAQYKDQPVRIVAVQRLLLGAPDAPVALTVQVAESYEARRQLTWQAARDAAVLQLLLIGVAALFIALGVRRGLAPLKRLRDEVLARAPQDLRPIERGHVPREVVPLIDAINRHTQRQRELTDAQVRFVANASHQLKTPLTLVQAQLDLARQQGEIGAMQAALAGLEAGTDKMRRLVAQLLSLARSEAGELQSREPVDLNALAQALCFDLLPRARERGVDLGFEPGPVPVVQAERALLQEAVHNIVENALLYTPGGGKVTVATQLREGHAVIEVTDTGPGIPAHLRARVLERFYRGPQTGPAAAPGSGLGLAITKEVCERLGVALALADGPGGRGLCVTMTWPAGP